MTIQNYDIFVQTTGKTDIIDITAQVYKEVGKSSTKNGTVNLFVPGSTAALFNH